MVDGAYSGGLDLPPMPNSTMMSYFYIASFLFRYYYIMHVSHGADVYANVWLPFVNCFVCMRLFPPQPLRSFLAFYETSALEPFHKV
jgi:hypothetical protein